MTINELKKELKTEKPIIGFEEAVKNLKNDKIAKIYVAINCHNIEELKTLCQKFEVPLVELKEDNIELGVICKKPFSISVLCFNKK